MLIKHWEAVASIYAEGIDTGIATYELTVPTWKVWDQSHLHDGRLVAVLQGNVVGWAALSPVSSRCVYGGIGEVSVYVANRCRGHQIGEKLLMRLIEESEKIGLWTVQSSVFPENLASLKLHDKLGFRRIGYREKVGKLNNVWKDNILLERRSTLVGVD